MQFLFGAKQHRVRNVLISLSMVVAAYFAAIWVNMGS